MSVRIVSLLAEIRDLLALPILLKEAKGLRTPGGYIRPEDEESYRKLNIRIEKIKERLVEGD